MKVRNNRRLWRPGDHARLKMGNHFYPALIEGRASCAEMHRDGSICWQYYATVYFPTETVTGGLVNHCMLEGYKNDH